MIVCVRACMCACMRMCVHVCTCVQILPVLARPFCIGQHIDVGEQQVSGTVSGEHEQATHYAKFCLFVLT